ncbi:hypothetical protein D3C86_1547640 [compost metagenome]
MRRRRLDRQTLAKVIGSHVAGEKLAKVPHAHAYDHQGNAIPLRDDRDDLMCLQVSRRFREYASHRLDLKEKSPILVPDREGLSAALQRQILEAEGFESRQECRLGMSRLRELSYEDGGQ